METMPTGHEGSQEPSAGEQYVDRFLEADQRLREALDRETELFRSIEEEYNDLLRRLGDVDKDPLRNSVAKDNLKKGIRRQIRILKTTSGFAAAEEERKAAQAAFDEIWEAEEPVLEEGADSENETVVQ